MKLYIRKLKIPPFKGAYYRAANELHTDQVIFDHIGREFYNDKKPASSVSASDFEEFGTVACMHNIEIIVIE